MVAPVPTVMVAPAPAPAPSSAAGGMAVVPGGPVLPAPSAATLPPPSTAGVGAGAGLQIEDDGPTTVAPDAPSLDVRMSTCTDVAPGTRHTCEQQRLFNKCDAEYMVRYAYCSQTCGRQPCKGCDDVAPTAEYNCTQQRVFASACRSAVAHVADLLARVTLVKREVFKYGNQKVALRTRCGECRLHLTILSRDPRGMLRARVPFFRTPAPCGG
ncbi:hypothetical protein PLESTF_000311200 [Pleodorina starrii]|nr:hypothetical protein PLESTF_000311200 [Pleodorina starrii]